VTQLANQNLEVAGETTITDTVEARIHVPSGAVLVLLGVAHEGVLAGVSGLSTEGAMYSQVRDGFRASAAYYLTAGLGSSGMMATGSKSLCDSPG
jgi:hypothetical protein